MSRIDWLNWCVCCSGHGVAGAGYFFGSGIVVVLVDRSWCLLRSSNMFVELVVSISVLATACA